MGHKGVSKRKPSQKKGKVVIGAPISTASSLVHDIETQPDKLPATLKTGLSTKSERKSTSESKGKPVKS